MGPDHSRRTGRNPPDPGTPATRGAPPSVAERPPERPDVPLPGRTGGSSAPPDLVTVVYRWMCHLHGEGATAEALTAEVVTRFSARRGPRWLQRQTDTARLRLLTVQAVLDHRRGR